MTIVWTLIGCAGLVATTERTDPLLGAFARAPRTCTVDDWCWLDPSPQGNDLNRVFVDDGVHTVGVGRTAIHGTTTSVDVVVEGDGWQSWDGVWAAAADDIWMVGDSGRIAHDDGTGPSLVPSPTGRDLHAVSGVAADDVWAGGNGGTVLHFDGVSWQEAPGFPNNNDLLSVFVLATDDVWVGDDLGNVYRWNGATWRREQLPGFGLAVFDLWGVDPNHVWAVANGLYVVDHTDGIWNLVDCGIVNPGFRGIGGLGANDVYVVGEDGDAAHFDGTSCSPVTIDRGNWADVDGSAALGMWAVGAGGSVAQWTGGAWSTIAGNPSGSTFEDVHGTDQAIWAVGQSQIVRYDVQTGAITEWPVTEYSAMEVWSWFDEAWVREWRFDGSYHLTHYAGGQWTDVDDAPSDPLGIWGADGEVWALGGGNVQIRHADGSWTLRPLPPDTGAGRLRGTATDDIWYGGSKRIGSYPYPSVMHWDGSTWTEQVWTDLRGATVVELLEIDLDNVWAGTDRGLLFHYDGSTWTQLPRVPGASQITGITITRNGELLVTENAFVGSVHRWQQGHWVSEAVSAAELLGLWTTRWGITVASGRQGTLLQRM